MALAHGVGIEIEARTLADHVRVTCTGAFTLDAAVQVFRRTFALAADAGREAALLDLRALNGAPTLAERYEIAVRAAEFQAARKPRVRLAVLGKEPLIHPERFGEIVAPTRGAVGRVFTDEALALQWLLGSAREP